MYYNEQILLQTENEYQNPRSVGTKSFTLLQTPHLIKKKPQLNCLNMNA